MDIGVLIFFRLAEVPDEKAHFMRPGAAEDDGYARFMTRSTWRGALRADRVNGRG
jgi:hypothetical protein